MNEPKIIPFIIYNSDNVEEKKEDSIEEYQIIKEDYCSSPKCGIKSKIVTKSVEKMNFSPIEISTNPYFKYCVIPIKDENFKYDFSQSETNNTRNLEEKNQKKYNNISNHQKNSYILLNNNELKEENNENDSENDSDDECENECENENICNYLNILEKNKSDVKLIFNKNENAHKDFNENDIKLKSKKVSLYKGSQKTNNANFNFHNSIILNQKRKLSLNECSEHKKKNRKMKISQRNVNKIFILNDENNKKEERQSNKSKNSSVFQSIKLKKNKIKNIKSNVLPFKLNKEKEEPVKVVSSYTATNINRFKKKKKSKDNKIIRTKTNNNIEKLDTSTNNNKKEKSNNINLFSDNDNSEEKVKNNNKNNSFNNVYNHSKSQKRPKRIKIKNLGEKPEILKNPTNNTRNNSDTKDKIKNNEILLKKKEKNLLNYKIKIENKYKKELFDNPKTAKKRRESMPEYFRFDYNKHNNILLEVKKEKKNLLNKKKPKMSEIDIEKDKDNDKDKEKNKEKGKEIIKSKEKENENENILKKMKIKDKKEKKKSKKKEKNRQKVKVKINDLINEKKNKNKYSAKNLKLLFKDLKQKSNSITTRKDRSLTTINKCNNNFIKNTTSKKLSAYQVPNFNIKNIRTIKRTESRDIHFKNNYGLNLDSSQKLQRCSRRNSTRILFHNKSQEEKITVYTNKQTIKNINEYTKRCLEIIPDLYALEEIPRCKAKIQPILNQNKKTKKIALFDLDETIVHCIGEINMNNVENFTRQCDAKLKVQLPGGKEVTIGINIRPNWEKALDIIKDKYHIIAYTASHESYADSVLNFLDPQQKYFEYRLYRNHCVLCFVDEMKFYVKDLGIFDEFCDLKDVVLIDNSVLSFAYHLDNGIPISPFYDSKDDCELLDISNFLLKYADEYDLRNKLREVYKLSDYLEIIKNNMSEDSITNSSSISIVKEEEERTNKNSYNNKKKNNNSTKNNPTIDNNNEEKNNNTFSKGKNSSQFLIYKEKFNLFEKIQDNKKRSKSFILGEKKYKPFDSRRVFNNSKTTINKSLELVKKKKKFKSVRYFDINFKKEWNEKQKELNSK